MENPCFTIHTVGLFDRNFLLQPGIEFRTRVSYSLTLTSEVRPCVLRNADLSVFIKMSSEWPSLTFFFRNFTSLQKLPVIGLPGLNSKTEEFSWRLQVESPLASPLTLPLSPSLFLYNSSKQFLLTSLETVGSARFFLEKHINHFLLRKFS